MEQLLVENLGVVTSTVGKSNFTEAPLPNQFDDETLDFVFSLSRHGARAPQRNANKELFSDDVALFKAESGMLTAQGMRQRYLKGRYNRDRLIHEHHLLSEEFTPGEIYI